MTVVGQSSIYDSADDVLNVARALVNDAAQDIQGDILTNDAPFTFVLLNAAYRYLQKKLANHGIETFTKESVMPLVTPVAIISPGTTVSISYTGYFDGVTNHPNPHLPDDMLVPLRLWERTSGTNNAWADMRTPNDGLPEANSQTSRLTLWDWRGDAIYFPGATNSNDLRLRYTARFQRLTDADSPVMVTDSLESLAFLVAASFANARGSPAAPDLKAQAEEHISILTNRWSRKKQRGSHRRMPYGGWGASNWQRW